MISYLTVLGVLRVLGGGKVIHDVVVLRMPVIFGGRTRYATGAGAASAVMVVLDRPALPTIGLVASTATGAA